MSSRWGALWRYFHENRKVGWALQAGAIVACIVFWRVLLPGGAIAVLGVVAVVIAIRSQMGHTEGLLWMTIVFVLLFVEIHALVNDRRQHEKQQADAFEFQRKHFNDIAEGLKNAIRQNQADFDATMSKSNTILKGLSNSINLQTGADSYLYFDPKILGDAPIEIAVPGLPKGSLILSAFPHFVGKFPLRRVYVSVAGPITTINTIDYGDMFPNEIGRPRQFIQLPFRPDRPKQHVNIFVTAANGSYSQVIVLRNSGNHWVWASQFSKYGTKKLSRTWADSGFPKKELNSNWNDY